MRAEALISETLKLEETRFRTTLARGLAILEDETRALDKGRRAQRRDRLQALRHLRLPARPDAGRAARARPCGRRRGFNAAMERQRAEARRAWAGSGEAATESVWFALRERIGATDFLGYDTETAEGVIRAIVKDGAEVERAGGRRERARSSSTRRRSTANPAARSATSARSPRPASAPTVTDTRKKLGDLIVHDVRSSRARRASGWRSSSPSITPRAPRHAPTIPRPISCTRRCALVLGDHVAQKGSLVAPDRLRFDFAHPKPISRDEIAAVEDIANRVVLENAEVTTRLMGLDDASALGARALFGEKYGDEVRVVTMGVDRGRRDARARPIRSSFAAARMCSRTGDIGLITIVGESAVAAGVRRIEAKTRDEARRRLDADSRGLRRSGSAPARAAGRGGRTAGSPDRRQAQARTRTRRRAGASSRWAAARPAGLTRCATSRA